jgi:Transposase IS116/IS110/IS902 family
MNIIATENQWVGIDVSQAWLDVVVRPAGIYWRFPIHSVRNRSAKADIEVHIEWLKERVKGLDAEIDRLRKESAIWQQPYEWLTSVPGVGRVVATTLLAALPELGQISSKKLSALVGLAPLNYDSGKGQAAYCRRAIARPLLTVYVGTGCRSAQPHHLSVLSKTAQCRQSQEGGADCLCP